MKLVVVGLAMATTLVSAKDDAGPVGPVNAVKDFSDLQWQQSYGVLRECLGSLGACLKPEPEIGMMAGSITQEACKTRGGVWKEPYGSWNDFKTGVEIAAEAVPVANKRIHIAELAAGYNQDSLANAIGDADISIAELIVCPSGEQYVLLDGSSADLEQVSGGIANFFPMAPRMKEAPLLELYEKRHAAGQSKGPFAVKFRVAPASKHDRRRQLSESSLGRSMDILKRWQEVHKHDMLEFGTGRTLTDTQTGQVLYDDAGHNGEGLLVRVAVKEGGPAALLRAISAEPEVLFAEPDYKMVAFNLDAALLSQGGIVLPVGDGFGLREDLAPFWTAGLKGQGQVVGVGDSGLDTSSCYFSDKDINEPTAISTRQNQAINDNPGHRKVVQYATFVDAVDGTRGHGTHVVGSIAGSLENVQQPESNVNSPEAFQGQAPAAKIAFADLGQEGDNESIFPPNNLGDMFRISKEAGARLHSNSWGGGTSYDGNAQDVDRFMFDNQDYLVLVAAGNSGFSNDGTVGSPATSKSCLSVGASKNTDHSNRLINIGCGAGKNGPCENNMADFSSSGPGPDGRIKPEIVAPGNTIISAEGGSSANPTETCRVFPQSGTSMATPVTAGNAALLRQFLTEGRFPTGSKNPDAAFTPMGSLIKALLINGAVPITGDYNGFRLGTTPSQVQGFGRLQLTTSVFLEGNRGINPNSAQTSIFLDGDANKPSSFKQTGESKTFNIEVIPAQDQVLKATLVWSDAPASTNSNQQIVNDLDLEVIAPDGTKFFPNGRTSPDRLNVVEQIVLTPEQVQQGGTWQVKVTANRISVTNSDGIQPFSVVVAAAWNDDTPPVNDNDDAEQSFVVAAIGVGAVLLSVGLVAIYMGRRHVRAPGAVEKTNPNQYRPNGPESKFWGRSGNTGRAPGPPNESSYWGSRSQNQMAVAVPYQPHQGGNRRY